MAQNQKNQQQTRTTTQWTAQFLAAAELCRKGYGVTFTMGNCTPDYDLVVTPQEGKTFYVDVKGLSSNSDWIIRRKDTKPNLFYILIKIDKENRENDKFFIMTQDEVNTELDVYYSKPKKDGFPKSQSAPGFNFKQAEKYKDNWEILPPVNGDASQQ